MSLRRACSIAIAVSLVATGVAPAGVLPPGAAAQAPPTLVVRDRAVGRTPLLIGANPGLTTAPNWEAWLRDSRMNAAREWANMEEIEPDNEDGSYGNGVADEAGFRAARAAVIAAPEANPYLSWPGLKLGSVDRRVGTYARVGIATVVVLRHSGSGSTKEANLPPWMANVPTSWADLWEWWEYCFAVAYHTAGRYGVTRFTIHSEPDRAVQGFGGRIGDYARLLAHGADAARAGVRAADPALAATIHAPALAEPTAREGGFLRTILATNVGDVDVVDYHQYGPSDGGEYATRAAEVRGIAAAAGAPRPLFVSEYNISRSGERGDVDDPADALALAEAQRQLVLSGVEGFLIYRFNYPSEFRNLSLVRSGSGSTRALVDETIGYEGFKQLATAAAGGKELLEVESSGPAAWLATRDAERVYLLGIHRGPEPAPGEIDLAALGLEGSRAIVRVASAEHRNEVADRPLVVGGRLSLVQPPLSTILVSVDRAPEPGPPAALRLEPPAAELDRHRVLQLRAVATLPDGSDWDVTDRVTWSSSDPAVARVHSTGLAASLTSGSVELTASWGELHSAPTALAVRP